MWSDIQEQAGRLSAEEEPFVLATVVAFKSPQSAKPGSKAIIKSDGSISGWVGGGSVLPIVRREAKKALQTGKPKLISISPEPAREDWQGVESFRMACEGGGSLEIYLEPVIPKPDLLIVGRSQVAQCVAELGRLLDFKVCLADPDATQEQIAEAEVLITDLNGVRSRINANTYVVVATMGNADEEGLLSVVGATPRYLGLVASEKKARSLFQYLRENGATDEQLARIKCPAGLELGGDSMPEIALSVMAEITQVRRASAVKTEPLANRSSLAAVPDSAGQTAELVPQKAFDPICGMTVDTYNANYTSVLENKTFYFCSLRCKESFDR
jgi:xanthine dehydrogenase accessory factor